MNDLIKIMPDSYKHTLYAYVKRQGNTSYTFSESTNISFKNNEFKSKLDFIEKIELHTVLGNTRDNSVSGFTVTNKKYGSENYSQGDNVTTYTSSSDIKNFFDYEIGSSYRIFYSGNGFFDQPDGTKVVQSWLSISDVYANIILTEDYYKPKATNLIPMDKLINQNNPTVFSWDYFCPSGDLQKKFKLDWKIGEIGSINSLAGNNENTITVEKNVFPSGSKIFWRITVTNVNDKSYTSEWVSFDTHISPTITSLEPNNIPQNGDNQILVTFTGANIDNWSLKLKQNNATIKSFSGTAITNIALEPQLLNKGLAQLELTATKNGSDVTATKTAEFVVYGKPNPPTINPQDVFNTSLPTFTWTVEQGEQVQYNFIVLNSDTTIHEQKTETSTTNKYTVTNNISNGVYTVKVRIKNGWDLWSDYAEKSITINYTVLPTPTINGYIDGSNVIVSVIEATIKSFSYNQLYRSEDTKTWTRVANNLKANDSVTDYTVSKGIKYYYKFRAIGSDGQFADSEVLNFTVDINNYLLTDMLTKNTKLIDLEPKSNYKPNREVSYNTYAGCNKPTIEYGTTNYKEVSLSMFAEPQLYNSIMNMIDTHTIVCLRDYMGKQIFGFIVDYKEAYEEYILAYNLTLDIVEVDFDTTDMLYSNGLSPVRIVYLDGKYKLDGSITLSGVVE